MGRYRRISRVISGGRVARDISGWMIALIMM